MLLVFIKICLYFINVDNSLNLLLIFLNKINYFKKYMNILLIRNLLTSL